MHDLVFPALWLKVLLRWDLLYQNKYSLVRSPWFYLPVLLSWRGRPSSIHRHRFLGNSQVDWHQSLVRGTYSPYLQTIFSLFFTILNFWFFFLHFFFLFINIGPYGRKKFKPHLFLKYAPDSLPQIMHTPGEDFYQNYWNNSEIWNFEF